MSNAQQQQQQLHPRRSSAAVGSRGASPRPNGTEPRDASRVYKRLNCLDCGYHPGKELLEYDYTYDEGPHNATGDRLKPQQPYPRIRERGEYYIDSYNDQPAGWTFGTNEQVRCVCACVCVHKQRRVVSLVRPDLPLTHSCACLLFAPYKERNLVQLGRSSRLDHVVYGVGTLDLFRPDRHSLGHYGRHSGYTQYDL
jgi:hypothetical protein